MTINHEGIKHERLVKKSENNEKNHYETLQTASSYDIPGLIPGKCYWRNGFKGGDGYIPLNIPFGAKIEDKERKQ